MGTHRSREHFQVVLQLSHHGHAVTQMQVLLQMARAESPMHSPRYPDAIPWADCWGKKKNNCGCPR